MCRAEPLLLVCVGVGSVEGKSGTQERKLVLLFWVVWQRGKKINGLGCSELRCQTQPMNLAKLRVTIQRGDWIRGFDNVGGRRLRIFTGASRTFCLQQASSWRLGQRHWHWRSWRTQPWTTSLIMEVKMRLGGDEENKSEI